MKVGNVKIKEPLAPTPAGPHSEPPAKEDGSITALPVAGSIVSIMPHPDTHRFTMKRLALECVGLDCLWMVALSARSHAVGAATINLLITLHVK